MGKLLPFGPEGGSRQLHQILSLYRREAFIFINKK